MGERVAVVGGTGFLGANLVVQLAQAGYTPIVIARRPQRAQKLFPDLDFEARYGDLMKPGSLRQALGGCSYVHSLAGTMGGVFTGPNPDRRAAAVQVNVDGTLNVLRAALDVRVRRVIVTSSCTTRYQPKGLLASEASPPVGAKVVRDPYVRSKVLAEQAVGAFSRDTGLKTVSILPAGMIGPRDASPTPLGAALLARLNGDPQGAVGLEGAFPIVDVRDVAQAHIAAMEAEDPGPAYLVVAMTIPTRVWNDLFSRITGIPDDAKIVPLSVAMPMALTMEAMAWLRRRPAKFNRNAVRHLTQSQRYDCSLVQNELGIRFTSLETTLRDTVRWYAENGWITDEARLAIVRSALDRAAYDAAPTSLSRRRSAAQA